MSTCQEEVPRTEPAEQVGISIEQLVEATVRTVMIQQSMAPAPALPARTLPNSEIAALLPPFSGTAEEMSVESFIDRVEAVKSAYGIRGDIMHLIMVSKLMGAAKDWYHSKLDNITMSLSDLLESIRRNFTCRPGRMVLMRKFEARKWKRSEKFQQYYHDKTILGNHVGLEEEEEDMIPYVIDGMDNPSLQCMARMKDFTRLQDLFRVMNNVIDSDRSVVHGRCPMFTPSNRARQR